jgi:hypothetical protein
MFGRSEANGTQLSLPVLVAVLLFLRGQVGIESSTEVHSEIPCTGFFGTV